MRLIALDEKLQIPYKDLKLVKEIGSGAFGKVFIAEWQATQGISFMNIVWLIGHVLTKICSGD
jgi:hypothetical protein